MDDETPPDAGERDLAALTSTDRTEWATVRREHLRKGGANRSSLTQIESAAFVLVLDEHEFNYEPVEIHQDCLFTSVHIGCSRRVFISGGSFTAEPILP